MSWTPSPDLSDAIAWALDLHGGQRRKGADTPYVGHLLSVAGLVIEFGGSQDQAIAAMLHDAIEDQGVTASDIDRRHGPRVARIVLACTDTDTLPKPPWRARKEAYIGHLEQAGPDVWLVSACDKLHNARAIVTDLAAIGPSVFARFTGGRDGTLWYYRSLADAFLRLLPGPLADELGRAVGAMERAALP